MSRRPVREPAPSTTWTTSRSALPPSACSTSTPTASSSPSRSRTTRARPSEGLRVARRFLNAWNDADRKQAIIEELAAQGVFLDELAEQVGRDYDAFDLVCHVAFDQPPLTRRERADKVKKRNVFGKYGDKARAVLEALLEKYADGGIEERRVARNSQSRSAHHLRHAGRDRQALRRQAALPRRHPRARNRTLPGSRLIHAQRLQHRQNHPGHHAQGRRHLRRRAAPRTARLDVLSQDLRRPREGTRTPPRQLQVAAAAAPALVRLGPPTTKASPATRCSTSSTTRSCPSSRR